jgi:uncharacterized damage-inducible protein DinB
MLEAYLQVLEMGYFEVTEAFKGLADENVWKRPAEGLLSVGELAGHIAYWEAVRLAGEMGEDGKPNLEKGKVQSPLLNHHFGYYPNTLASSPPQECLSLTAEEVCKELVRVHTESVAHFRELNPDLESSVPGWDPFWTYAEFLKYAAFHISYHTGQIYTARHLLGEETPDN